MLSAITSPNLLHLQRSTQLKRASRSASPVSAAIAYDAVRDNLRRHSPLRFTSHIVSSEPHLPICLEKEKKLRHDARVTLYSSLTPVLGLCNTGRKKIRGGAHDPT